MKNIKHDFWLILLGIILLILILIFSGNNSFFLISFANYIDPFIGILTFLLALIIAYRTWSNKLPKKLTVNFKYNHQFIFTCHKTYLAGEGDIRQWGQQIGKQMNGNKNLDFYPYIKEEKPIVEYEKNKTLEKGNYFKWLFNNNLYKHYEVTFFLSKIPNNAYTIWWDNDSDTPANQSLIIEQIITEKINIETAEMISSAKLTNPKSEKFYLTKQSIELSKIKENG